MIVRWVWADGYRLKAHPIDHINVLTNRQILANSLRELAETQPAQARERVLQLADAQITLSLDGMLKTLSEDRQELANARFRFAQIKLALGQNAQAIEPLKAAAHFYRAQPMANPSRLTALKNLEAQLGVR